MKSISVDFMIYLNTDLLNNISSVTLPGFLDIQTTRLIKDRVVDGGTDTHRCNTECNETEFCNQITDGVNVDNSKGENNIKQENYGNIFLRNTDTVRVEEEFRSFNTSSTLYRNLINNFKKNNELHEFNSDNFNPALIYEGEIVKIKGEIIAESLQAYLSTIVTILSSLNLDGINKLIPCNFPTFIDYNYILSITTDLLIKLQKDNTQDMIFVVGDTKIVLQVNNNFFATQNVSAFDEVGFPCTVFGKVIRKSNEENCISLLRKSMLIDYYTKLFISFKPYFELLENYNIILPKMTGFDCKGLFIDILPICITV